MSGKMKGPPADYVEVSERIQAMLDALPQGSRGPKATRLRSSLTQDLPLDVCWPWQGRRGRNGYGLAVRPMSRNQGTTAHRLVWELLNGEPPEGWHVDHLCHDPADCGLGPDCPHRACVNPTHLAAVPASENVLRGDGPSARNAVKVSCHKGHPFVPENTYVDPQGRRGCRECYRAHWRRYAREAS